MFNLVLMDLKIHLRILKSENLNISIQSFKKLFNENITSVKARFNPKCLLYFIKLI